MIKKGIIAEPEMEIVEGGIRINQSLIPQQRLFHYLLYWDQIAVPTNNIIHIPPQPEIRFLEREGEARTIHFQTEGSFKVDHKFFFALQNITLHQLTEITDIEWNIGKPLRKELFYPEASELRSIIEMELYNAIPVPSGEHHLEDVLNFKRKRYAELLEFRYEMDRMVLEAQINHKNPIFIKKQIKKIEHAIEQIERCLNENKLAFAKRSTKVIANNPAHAFGDIAAAVSSVFYPAATLPILLASGGFSVISSLPRIMRIDKRIPSGLKPYTYIAYAKNEFEH